MKTVAVIACLVAQIAMISAQGINIVKPVAGTKWTKQDMAQIEWSYASDFNPCDFQSVTADLMRGNPGPDAQTVMHIHGTEKMEYAGVGFAVPSELPEADNYFVQLNVKSAKGDFNVQGKPISVVSKSQDSAKVVAKSAAGAREVLTVGGIALSAVATFLML